MAKKRLNHLEFGQRNGEQERKKRRGGIRLSGNGSDVFRGGFASIPLVAKPEMETERQLKMPLEGMGRSPVII